MSPLRRTYLALAIWGAVHPMFLLGRWVQARTGTLADQIPDLIPDLIAAWFVNAASGALVWDLVIAAITLTIWVIAETTVRRNWIALMAIPATFLIGVSCGLPLYLFLRTRPVG